MFVNRAFVEFVLSQGKKDSHGCSEGEQGVEGSSFSAFDRCTCFSHRGNSKGELGGSSPELHAEILVEVAASRDSFLVRARVFFKASNFALLANIASQE